MSFQDMPELREITKTDNGANALKTTGSDIVDYFMMYTRTLQKKDHHAFLKKCWAIDPQQTVAIIFNGRDRLAGKKEKKVSNEGMLWLRKNKPKTYRLNVTNYINMYGCWKDLLYIAYHLTSSDVDKQYELEMFAFKLRDDKKLLEEDPNKSVSLCAKWAPSENDRNDQRKHFAKKIASLLYTREDPKKMEKYRKEYLVPLRKRIGIVEQLICNNEWSKVNYEAVPGVASKRLLNAFKKHDGDRYAKFLEAVRKGEKQIKITGLLPHELAKYYIDHMYTEAGANETIELQWRTLLENVQKEGTLNNALAVIDLSGSMFGASNGSIPAQVATALGILTSLCSSGPFNKRFITFSEKPQLGRLSSEGLYDAYQIVRYMHYGLNTDFVKCCKCIIQHGLENNIPDKNMPKKLFVFTDLQFDKASSAEKSMETVYEHIVKLFQKYNYTAPKFIFWYLGSNTLETFPVDCSTPNTAMVSGYSEQLIKIFIKYDEFDPAFILKEITEPYLKNIIIDPEEARENGDADVDADADANDCGETDTFDVNHIGFRRK